MAELQKKYSGAPFGVQTPRFDVAGVHPASKMPASFTQVSYCHRTMEEDSRKRGPGLYDIELGGFKPDAVLSKASGPGWARQYELQQLSALPHLLHKEQWETKSMLSRKLGPGSYNIKDSVGINDEKPHSKYGICSTKAIRFKPAFSEKTPGPGTYGNGGIPHSAIEETAAKSTSTVGMLDAASSGQRDLPTVGCHLGPGNYRFKSSADMLKEKRVSTRGPYELFSIDRNKPMKTGHLATFGASTLGPGQYQLSSFTDDIEAYNNKKKGEFGKTVQHPQQAERIFYSTLSQVPITHVTPSLPCPTSYNPKIDMPKPENHGHAGFLSNAQRSDKQAMTFFTGNFNQVGAGRYEVQKFHDSRHINGHESVFKSKTGYLTLSQEKSFRERLREKDVLKGDRIHLVEPERPPYYYANNLTDHFTTKRTITVA